MNKYVISLYNGTSWVDISNYIQTGINISDMLDESLDNASFTIPYIKADSILGIDLSKAIPPYTPIKIDIKDFNDSIIETYRMYTSNPRRNIIKKSTPKLYSHEVDLIEVTRILQRKIISDMTITQPKSAIFQGAYFSDSKSPTEKITVNNTPIIPTLTTQNQCLDSSIIVDRILKAGNNGDLFILIDIWNSQFNKSWYQHLVKHFKYTSAETKLKIEVLINDVLFETDEYYIKPATSKRINNWFEGYEYVLSTEEEDTYVKHYSIPSSTNDQQIKVRLSTIGKYEKKIYTPTGVNSSWSLYSEEILDDTLKVTPYITLSSQVSKPEKFTYLDEAVDKILSLFDIKDKNDTTIKKYKLDDNTRGKIKEVLCPEFTFTSYTVWDALEKISRVVNAIPEIDNDDFCTISFNFLDDIPDVVYDESMFNNETMSYVMDNYNSALQINASNVIEEDVLKNVKVEPYQGGWLSTRANSDLVEQITEDNSSFKLRQDIYRIYKMYIKGLGVKIVDTVTAEEKILYGTNNTDLSIVTNQLNSNNYFDISDRVVEVSEWNIYMNKTENGDDDRRLAYNTKGNHIYYSQGSKYINGLGFKTDVKSDFGGSTIAPRALIETIFCTVAEYIKTIPELSGYIVAKPTGWDLDPESALTTGSHSLFDGILAQIHYIPIANVRSNIYKHNTWDLNLDTVNFSNEQDAMNDTTNLGRFVSNAVNKLGNIEYTVSGQKTDYVDIPRLGYKTTNDLVVTSRTLNLHKNLIDYTLQLSENFINQNYRLSPNSKHRQYEVPQKDNIMRQDIFKQFIILTEDKTKIIDDYSILSLYGKQKLIQNFCNLTGSNNTPLTYGKIKVTKEKDATYTGNEVTFDMPINGFSIGNTINLQLQFDSNYSAGPKKLETTINEDIFKYQSYTNYTDQFGKVYSIDLSLYSSGILNNTETDADNYPELSSIPTSNSNINLSLDIYKDARELYALNIEIPFITAEPNVIRIYQGISKYNGLIRSKDSEMEIGVALLENGYFPAINQTTLNTERVLVVPNEGVYEFDSVRNIYGIYFSNINVPINTTYEGYVVYEKNTRDIIYAVKRGIPDGILYTTPTIWFIPKTHLNDRTIPL